MKNHELYFCMLLEEDLHLTNERLQHPGIFNGKYIVVAVKADPQRNWIITAFISSRMPIGDLYEY